MTNQAPFRALKTLADGVHRLAEFHRACRPGERVIAVYGPSYDLIREHARNATKYGFVVGADTIFYHEFKLEPYAPLRKATP